MPSCCKMHHVAKCNVFPTSSPDTAWKRRITGSSLRYFPTPLLRTVVFWNNPNIRNGSCFCIIIILVRIHNTVGSNVKCEKSTKVFSRCARVLPLPATTISVPTNRRCHCFSRSRLHTPCDSIHAPNWWYYPILIKHEKMRGKDHHIQSLSAHQPWESDWHNLCSGVEQYRCFFMD